MTTARPSFAHALPFWASMALVPLTVAVAVAGGWWILLSPAATWLLFSGLDAVVGLDRENLPPDTPESALVWHRLVTLVWPPVQFALVFGLLAYATRAAHLSVIEEIGLFFGIGVLTGTVGITYAHELMHRPGRFERWQGDVLMAMVIYGHFRSEHLVVHHAHVGTPRDTVTARYSEGFPRYFARVLPGSVRSAWRAEKARLARKGLPWWDRANPFWRYWGLQAMFLLLAVVVAGWAGFALFLYQAFIAIWQLELVNYVEHYGLTRKHLGGGRYEPARPHHSWNATHKASNRLLINLQRHSDHHAKPGRPFPLLQSGAADEVPELPHGYPVMTMAAMVPPVWRRMMNPRVRKWRAMYYPEITDWVPYTRAAHPSLLQMEGQGP
jgi:alkane 1-monooxygenase